MPIKTMQQRVTEIGRIRIGKQTPTKNGKTRPEKLEHFRFTSLSKPLIERVASLYGGEVAEWNPPAGKHWEVVSDTNRVPVLVPPQSTSQYFELWSGGGIQRRCDGIDELVSGGGCLCDENDMPCKPTTRLSVMLRDVEGLGLWRLESHGWFAARELPGLATFLESSSAYVPAWLEIQWRQIKKPDEKYPRNFAVPVLDVETSPAALLSGAVQQIGQKHAPAIEQAPAVTIDRQSLLMAVHASSTLEELQSIWREAAKEGVLDDEVKEALKTRAGDLGPAPAAGVAASKKIEPADPDGHVKTADELWLQIVQSAPADWSSSQLEAQFEAYVGVPADKAGAEQMKVFLAGGLP